MWNNNSQKLPIWFRRPTPLTGWQVSLFPPVLSAVLPQLRVSRDELVRWNKNGWISFDASETVDIEEPQIWEITFVRDVVRSGLSDAYIEELFNQLPRPFNFNPLTVGYSFSLGWVEAEKFDPGEIIQQYLEQWLEELLEEDDIEHLENMVALFEGFIEKIKERDLEVNE